MHSGGNKIGGLVAAAFAAMLLLGGCSAGPTSTAADDVSASPGEATPDSALERSVQDAAVEADTEDVDARLVGIMRESARGLDSMTDDEWVTAGHAACDQMAAGTAVDAVDAIELEPAEQPQPGWNDMNLAGIAQELYCPEVERTFTD